MSRQVLLWGLSKNDFYDFRLPERLKLDMKREPQRTADHFRQECERAWPLVETSTKADLRFGGFHMFAYMVFWVATPLKMMGAGNLRRNMVVPSKSKELGWDIHDHPCFHHELCWVWNRVPQSPWLILIYVIMSIAIDWGYLDKPLILRQTYRSRFHCWNSHCMVSQTCCKKRQWS